MDHNEYVNLIKSCIEKSAGYLGGDLDNFCKRCTYICNDGDGDGTKPFVDLRNHMEELGNGNENQDRFFYMALPPKAYVNVSEQLKVNCYSQNGISRIIVSLVF